MIDNEGIAVLQHGMRITKWMRNSIGKLRNNCEIWYGQVSLLTGLSVDCSRFNWSAAYSITHCSLNTTFWSNIPMITQVWLDLSSRLKILNDFKRYEQFFWSDHILLLQWHCQFIIGDYVEVYALIKAYTYWTMLVLCGFWTPCLVVHLIINNLGFLTTSHAQQVGEKKRREVGLVSHFN